MYTELFSHCVILALLQLQYRQRRVKREIDHVTMKFTLSLNLPLTTMAKIYKSGEYFPIYTVFF